MYILFTLIGIFIGATITWLYAKSKFQQRIANLDKEKAIIEEKMIIQKEEIEKLQSRFTLEFENIANRILKQNSIEFTSTNQKNINDILVPLKEKIDKFEKKVEETYDKGLRDNVSLKAEVKKLYDLNTKISEEANNLTKALKGDVKKQGNWGEFILEKILERSGLTKGQEYETQVNSNTEEGRRIQPDVIVYLPDKKHIIIDAKVSLIAYEKYVNATSEEERTIFVKEHLNSIKTHIKLLTDKKYQLIDELNTPDFVLMFMPIEASFGVAIQEDQELFNFAWDRNIVIVSPSTLLATLRTIASIWKQENQTHNALEIARQSGALYDKLVNFVNDLDRVGKNIDQLHNAYDDAMNKLQTGKGNLINRATAIKELGAKTSKELPDKYIETSEQEIENV